MAKRNSERVREISYTTGTGPIALARPVIGYRSMAEAGCVDGDTVDLTIEGVSSVGTPTGDWEVGTYTWSTGGVLTRTTITASSNGGAAVNWTNGTRWVHGRSSGTVDGDGNSGGVATDAQIAAWAGNPDDLYTGAVTLDVNGAKVSAAVAWPDGGTGVYSATATNADYPSVVDAYTITHVLSGITKTATQGAVTRDAAGVVIVYPLITVA